MSHIIKIKSKTEIKDRNALQGSLKMLKEMEGVEVKQNARIKYWSGLSSDIFDYVIGDYVGLKWNSQKGEYEIFGDTYYDTTVRLQKKLHQYYITARRVNRLRQMGYRNVQVKKDGEKIRIEAVALA